MQITDILSQMGGIQQIAKELGISESQAMSGAAALAPAILGGFKKQAQSESVGAAGLGGLLSQLGGGGLLDAVLSPTPTDASSGNSILGQIFGSKDVSRTVAEHAAGQSGVDAGVLRKMLPLLAMMVAGYMAKNHGGSGDAQPAAASGGLGGLLGGILGAVTGGGASGGAPASGGGLASMIDMNHDGNPLDDILRMAGKVIS